MCLLSNTPCRALNQYTTTSVRKPGRKTEFYRNWNETDQSSFIIQAKRKCKKIKIKSKQTAQMVRREFQFLDSFLFYSVQVSSGIPRGLPPFPSQLARPQNGLWVLPCPPSPLSFSSTALRTCPPGSDPHRGCPSPLRAQRVREVGFQEPWLGLT